MNTEAFTCPRCGMTSHHPDDVTHGYCGNCHDWTGDIQAGLEALAATWMVRDTEAFLAKEAEGR